MTPCLNILRHYSMVAIKEECMIQEKRKKINHREIATSVIIEIGIKLHMQTAPLMK